MLPMVALLDKSDETVGINLPIFLIQSKLSLISKYKTYLLY